MHNAICQITWFFAPIKYDCTLHQGEEHNNAIKNISSEVIELLVHVRKMGMILRGLTDLLCVPKLQV